MYKKLTEFPIDSKRLSDLMFKRGWSPTKLSLAITDGQTETLISQWMHRGSRAKRENADRLCRILGCSADYLFHSEETVEDQSSISSIIVDRERLIDLMAKKGWSANRLSLAISDANNNRLIRDWINNETIQPSEKYRKRICRILEVPEEYIFHKKEPSSVEELVPATDQLAPTDKDHNTDSLLSRLDNIERLLLVITKREIPDYSAMLISVQNAIRDLCAKWE